MKAYKGIMNIAVNMKLVKSHIPGTTDSASLNNLDNMTRVCHAYRSKNVCTHT